MWTMKLLAGVLVLATVSMVGCDNKLKTERDALYAQNQDLQNELSTTRQALEAAEADRARMTEQLAQSSAAPAPTPIGSGKTAAAANPFEGIGGVEVEQGGGQITVRVPGDVLFDSGKATLRSGSRSTLSQIAGVLKKSYSGKTVRIEGYTDSDPIRKSKWADNLQLSAERAMAVQRYLADQGVPMSRMYSAGFGSAKPRETKTKSRRVEIVVVQ
jgi:flagellar motor protein MotB